MDLRTFPIVFILAREANAFESRKHLSDALCWLCQHWVHRHARSNLAPGAHSRHAIRHEQKRHNFVVSWNLRKGADKSGVHLRYRKTKGLGPHFRCDVSSGPLAGGRLHNGTCERSKNSFFAAANAELALEHAHNVSCLGLAACDQHAQDEILLAVSRLASGRVGNVSKPRKNAADGQRRRGEERPGRLLAERCNFAQVPLDPQSGFDRSSRFPGCVADCLLQKMVSASRQRRENGVGSQIWSAP